MANQMVTANTLSRDSVVLLDDALVLGNSVNRDVEQEFTNSSGGKVTVTYVPSESAKTQDHNLNSPSSLTTDDITEESTEVDALHYVYKKKTLTSKQKSYELNDFTEKVVRPSVNAIATEIEGFLANRLTGGFARYLHGTDGNAIAAKGDITSARKMLFDQGCPMDNIVGLLDSQGEKNMLDLDIFENSDYANAGNALVRAQLPPRFGIGPWITSSEAGTHVQGDTAGTPVLDSGATTGDTEITISGFDAGQPTLYPGTRFTLAGTSTVYNVVEKAIGSSNTITVKFSPALTSDQSSSDAVTFKSAYVENAFFHPQAVAAAIVAPEPLLNNSNIAAYNGMSIRVTMESTTGDTTGAADFILFDCYVGCKVLREEFGIIVQS